MNIRYGNGQTEFGPGVEILLTGEEIATAVFSWLVGHGVHINGPRTIRINGGQISDGSIYVDPSGFVVCEGEKFSGDLRSI